MKKIILSLGVLAALFSFSPITKADWWNTMEDCVAANSWWDNGTVSCRPTQPGNPLSLAVDPQHTGEPKYACSNADYGGGFDIAVWCPQMSAGLVGADCEIQGSNCVQIPEAPPVLDDGMPELTGVQVSTLLGGLGVAMTGIIGFLADSAAIWLVLAAAMIVFYFIKKWLNIKNDLKTAKQPSYKIGGKGKFVPSNRITYIKSKL